MVKLYLTMNRERGYTLIETLIVLFVISVLITISMSRYYFEDHEDPPKEFFQQFEKDVFYSQQKAATYQIPISITINSSDRQYLIHDSTQQPSVMTQSYHPDIRIYLSTLKNPIRFNTDGTIINPGKMVLYYKDEQYNITFPFGKGRFYVTKVS